MRRLGLVRPTVLFPLLVLGLAVPAFAGPNHGGTLVVHDTGLAYSTDMTVPPASPPPADCASVDNNAAPDLPTVWKVYAAFPEASSPRLKALAWGIRLTAGVVVLDGGLPDPLSDFAITQGGWPYTDGASIGQSFGVTRTDLINECYWFGGYAPVGEIFGTGPHEMGASIFVDDSSPPQEDPIVGFSSMGFGVPGATIICPDPVGACCFVDGSCLFLAQIDCEAQQGIFQGAGVPCVPGLCVPTPADPSSWGRIKAGYR